MFIIGIASAMAGLILCLTLISLPIGIPLILIGLAMSLSKTLGWLFSAKPESAKGNPLGTIVGMVTAVLVVAALARLL